MLEQLIEISHFTFLQLLVFLQPLAVAKALVMPKQVHVIVAKAFLETIVVVSLSF